MLKAIYEISIIIGKKNKTKIKKTKKKSSGMLLLNKGNELLYEH